MMESSAESFAVGEIGGEVCQLFPPITRALEIAQLRRKGNVNQWQYVNGGVNVQSETQ